MKKKYILLISGAALFMLLGLVLFKYQLAPTCSTTAQREMRLDQISNGSHWTIEAEQTIGNCIISGICSTDGTSHGIAVFKSIGHGRYQFVSSESRAKRDIVVSVTRIDGIWYDLIFSSVTTAEYATLTYTINGQPEEVRTFETERMPLICTPAPANRYSLEVTYCDSDGNSCNP